MKTTVKWEQPTTLFTGTLYDVSKLVYKTLMSFTEFQHRLHGLAKH